MNKWTIANVRPSLIKLSTILIFFLSGTATSREIITGTAIILNPTGDMLTNRHVIDGCEKIFVRLHNETAYRAVVVSVSKSFDMAILKIDGAQISQHAWVRTNEAG